MEVQLHSVLFCCLLLNHTQIPEQPKGGLGGVKKEGRQNIIIPGVTCFLYHKTSDWSLDSRKSEVAPNSLR